MALTKVLITVKTYPAISSKYDEIVCTAGFLEDGSWIRIYPVQFRQKAYDEQYKKYDWIEIDLVKNAKDFRPESYRPDSNDSEIKILSHLNTDDNWRERKNTVLKNRIYDNLDELISKSKNKNICTSLAIFKPYDIFDFTIEQVEREWDRNLLEKLRIERQTNLFKQEENIFEVVKKLPFKFSYRFRDSQGKESKMMIEDWEIGQLFWNCLARHNGDESKVVEDVRKKYFDDFAKTKDLYLFLGTTKVHHYVSKNPFMIIGTFHPKIDLQQRLF